MSILLPLYMYPWPGVWDPLYWAAGNYTNLNFTVVLNPCSGPCVGSLPEQPYITEMPKLKKYPNIRTLGYVATNYTNKAISEVITEVDIYASWARIIGDPKVAVDGIFFDETPGVYDWQAYDYLKKARTEVKNLTGLGKGIVVHNPGTIPNTNPDYNYLDLADITVAFEETYMNFLDSTNFNSLKTLATDTKLPKSSFAIMLHTLPNVPDDLLDWTVKNLKQMTGWVYLTSAGTPGEYWHSFSSLFNPFVKKLAVKNSELGNGTMTR